MRIEKPSNKSAVPLTPKVAGVRKRSTEEEPRDEAIDLSRIEDLKKQIIGVTPGKMEDARKMLDEARKAAPVPLRSEEWQTRFDEVLAVLTTYMGITPPLARQVANAILFAPHDNPVRPTAVGEISSQVKEGNLTAAGEIWNRIKPEELDADAEGMIEAVLHDSFVEGNEELVHIASESRKNDQGDEIDIGPVDVKQSLESQQSVLEEMTAVAKLLRDAADSHRGVEG